MEPSDTDTNTMKYTRIFLPALAAVTLAACHRPVQPRFEPVVLDTLLTHPLGTCQVDYRFASIANAAKSEALQIIEQSNTNYFFQLEDFEGPASEALVAAMAQLRQELRIGDPDYPDLHLEYEISAESEGSVVRDTLLTYTIYRSDYTGGAHGNYSTEYHLYSLKDGFEFTAGDFFGEEKTEALLGLIRKKLYEKYNASNDQELSDNGFFPEYLSVTDNFRVTPDGVTFLYNPYEISCYANGSIEVEISNEELKAL